MQQHGVRAIVLRYGCAVVSVALLIILRLLLDPVLATRFPFETLYFALLLSAWYGGRGPAILALVLSILGSSVFLLPARGSILVNNPKDQIGLALFALSGLGISILAGFMHDARRKAEAAAALTRRQASLIGQTHDAILVWEWNGPITFWNQGAEKLYGFTSQDALGRPEPDLLHTGEAPGVAPFAGALEREGSWEGELRQTTRDGRTLTVDSRMVINREGHKAYVLEIDRDITGQKRAEAALRDANEQLETRVRARTRELEDALDKLRVSEGTFRLLVEGVQGHSIFMLDPAGVIATWNSGAENISGFTAAEMLGQPYSKLFTPENAASAEAEREIGIAAAAGRVDVEGWRIRKGGSRYWATGALNALHDANGAVRGFASITRDLTAKRRDDAMLRSVLDHTVDGIVSIDERGIVSMINRAGETLFDRASSEIVGQNVKMLMPEPYRSQHDGYIENYLRTGRPRLIGFKGREVRAQKRSGATFPAALAVTEFWLDGQRHFVGILRDISTERALESQLQQSQKMEAFGQLAGGVAHDFNNLLTVISGYCDLLLESAPEGDQKGMVGEIRAAAERATALTRQLLAFSRQQVLKPQVLDLNSIVMDLLALLRRLIPESVKISTTLQPGLSPVMVDPVQIQQVIMNLAVNARDAMPRGGQLLIETKNLALDEAYVSDHTDARVGEFVRLAISDSGVGMSAETRARIFEPFFTTKTAGKGTGLGLAVVHGIVRQSGGSIEVYSEPGIGTTFKIYLPAIAAMPSGAAKPAVTVPRRGKETVLLAEDEQSVRVLAHRALLELGYVVFPAAGGREALRLAEAHPGKIDLLVTDVVMPEMSGRELASALRARRPGLKVLFMSGYTDDAILHHGVLQSEVAFLHKPFTPRSLGLKVQEVLDRETQEPTDAA